MYPHGCTGPAARREWCCSPAGHLDASSLSILLVLPASNAAYLIHAGLPARLLSVSFCRAGCTAGHVEGGHVLHNHMQLCRYVAVQDLCKRKSLHRLQRERRRDLEHREDRTEEKEVGFLNEHTQMAADILHKFPLKQQSTGVS